MTHDIGWNYTARDELGRPVAAGGFTPSQWKMGGAFSGTRGFAAGVGSATWASRSASSIAPLMLSMTANCAFCPLFLHRRRRGPFHPFDRLRFRFHPFLPIARVMLMFLLIALFSIAMIDTAVGVVARVGRR